VAVAVQAALALAGEEGNFYSLTADYLTATLSGAELLNLPPNFISETAFSTKITPFQVPSEESPQRRFPARHLQYD
jgi:hypothetical protein